MNFFFFNGKPGHRGPTHSILMENSINFFYTIPYRSNVQFCKAHEKCQLEGVFCLLAKCFSVRQLKTVTRNQIFVYMDQKTQWPDHDY